MICCKIVTDFNNKEGHFTELCNSLLRYGDMLFENGYMYFGDTENIKTDEKTIRRILKKSGYQRFYIDVYNKENQPQETDDSINGWLTDKLIRINYNLYELQSQKLFRDISKGLDLLDREIKEIESKQAQENIKEEEL